MIDELVLEQLLGELAEEIEVPADGAYRVVHELNTSSRPLRRAVPRRQRLAMVAAAVIVVVGLGVVVNNGTKSPTTKVSSGTTAGVPAAVAGVANSSAAADRVRHAAKSKSVAINGGLKLSPNLLGQDGAGDTGLVGAQGPSGAQGGIGLPGPQGVQGDEGIVGVAGPIGAPGVSPQSGTKSATANSSATGSTAAFGAVDGAKIIKTGSLDLQLPKGTLQSEVLFATHVTVGVGGYVTRSQSNLDPATATAQMTLRVPVGSFENAIRQLTTSTTPKVKVLNESENGVDVSAQYFNVQAQMQADTGERDSLLVLLSHTNSLGDILTLRDRITNVQASINQSQGELNVLSDQSTYSSISLFASEKPPKAPKPKAVHHALPPTGLSKSWKDARQGFANVVEWLIARSGGALILLLSGLLLLFALRYLYPVMRRALL